MDEFEKRLTAARSAGWNIWFLCFIGLLVEWGAYFALMKSQPAWFLDFWGGGMTWDALRVIWGGALIHYKYGLWFFLLLLLWAWVWERNLKARKSD